MNEISMEGLYMLLGAMSMVVIGMFFYLIWLVDKNESIKREKRMEVHMLKALEKFDKSKRTR